MLNLPPEIVAPEPLTVAAAATVELMMKLRISFAFVGDIALSAWLGRSSVARQVDLLAVVSPEGKQQIPMMAGHRGFELDRELIEATEEFDLVPMAYCGVKIHVLIASNALYGRMVAAAVPARLGSLDVKIAAAEDLALLLTFSDATDSLLSRNELVRSSAAEFDIARFNRKLVSLGVSGKAIPT
ncbi:MAG TPA: hypothetical protein VNM92_13745 [Thermoanaerobaculia bacterium]|nr:hypothetical protein [Thermoanaerobaculia bacterium]